MKQLVLGEIVRTRECGHCGKSFTYAMARGNDRKYCGDKCKRHAQVRKLRERLSAAPKCSTEGCGKVANRISRGLCEACYCQEWRTGSVKRCGAKPRKGVRRNREYILEWAPEHPLSGVTGMVLQHRRIVHDRHIGVCPPCHWCGAELTWKTAVVDHVDDNKENNASENLVAACNTCNLYRTQSIAFMARITTDAMIEVMQMVANSRKCHRVKETASDAHI
jgi:hypothetical protein